MSHRCLPEVWVCRRRCKAASRAGEDTDREGICKVTLNMMSPCTSALPSHAQIQLGQGSPRIRDLTSFYFCLNFIPFIYWLFYSCVLWHVCGG